MANADFINEIAADAQRIYKKYNILASLIIAQGCLESAWGVVDWLKRERTFSGLRARITESMS
ncbi:hypothetical protein S101413_03524 [Bacillus velezensis]|nr:hypothetical protein S101413_02920 [Bacillus velezensis]ASB66941.1 hypothetical protein S101413_03524 [Bacillus velezensis]